VAPRGRQTQRVPAAGRGVLGGEHERPRELGLGARVVALVEELREAERVVPFGEPVVDLHCPLRGLFRAGEGVGRRRLDVPVQERVALGHGGQRLGEARV
jgi:hypothetical protein